MFVLLVNNKFDSIWNNENEDDFLEQYIATNDLDKSKVEVISYNKKEFNKLQVMASRKKTRLNVGDDGSISVSDIEQPAIKTITNPSWKTPHKDDGLTDADYLVQKDWDGKRDTWENNPSNFLVDAEGVKRYTKKFTPEKVRPFENQIELITPEKLKVIKSITPSSRRYADKKV